MKDLISKINISSLQEAEEILKSAGTEELFEKAKHQDGDMHPNGKWVWVSSANGGKGDWRTKGGRTHTKHSAGGNAGTGSTTTTQQKPTTTGIKGKKENKQENKKKEILPEKMVDGDKITIKVKGKNYLIKHFEENDKSYGKFHIFLDDQPIKLFDYGVGHKFHGYAFDKKYKAYDALKKFFDSL